VNRTVIVNNESHVAFNGGEGGVTVRPTPQEESFAREPHTPPVAEQVQHERAASQNRALFASENHGAPAVAATARPGEFSGHSVVAAKAAGEPYHAPAISPREARAAAPAENRPAENRVEPANRSSAPPHEEMARPANEARPQNEARPVPRENAPKESAPKAKPEKKNPPKHEGEKEPKGF
jgi:hypothetical protein